MEQEAERAAARLEPAQRARLGLTEATLARRPEVAGVLGSAGRPLEPSARVPFEALLAHDLREVRVHTGPRARAAARSLGATAFAAGTDVVLGEGAPPVEHPAGRRVLAHELAHVVQQTGSAPDRAATPLSRSPVGVARQGPGADPAPVEEAVYDVPVTYWALEDLGDLVPPGSPASSAGLAMHVLASGHMGWLPPQAAAGRVFTIGYWSPMLPRPNAVVLERIANVVPRNLAPRIASDIAEGGSLSWAAGGFFREEDLLRIPEYVRKFNAGTIAPRELEVLRLASAIQLAESVPGSPLVSYTEPGHDIQANLKKSYGQRKWRVAMEFDADAVLDVSRGNEFNRQGALRQLRNNLEREWQATTDSRGRIVSVQEGSGPPGFAMRNARALRWAGRGMVGVGLGLSAARIATAAPEERAAVLFEEGGGQIGGALGGALAVAGCILIGGVTAGVGLFVCGFVGGVIGGVAGGMAGGALEADLAATSGPRESECPTCHELQRRAQATGTLDVPVELVLPTPIEASLLDLLLSAEEAGTVPTPEQLGTFQQWLELSPPQ